MSADNTPTIAGVEAVWVNGRPEDNVGALDRGLHFGDGLFETIACHGSRPRFLSLHLQRLDHGCERLRISGSNLQVVEAEVLALARQTDRCIIKVLITRGSAVGRGYAPAGSETATRVTVRYAWPQEDVRQWRDGVAACVLPLRLGENAALAGLKHCNRLEMVLARAQLPAHAWEGLLFSRSEWLVSGTMTNVFLVRSSTVLTPRINLCGVKGIMREVVLELARRAAIAVEERDLSVGDLNAAEEIFLTNARIGILPVQRLGERVVHRGPLTSRLQLLLEPLLQGGQDA